MPGLVSCSCSCSRLPIPLDARLSFACHSSCERLSAHGKQCVNDLPTPTKSLPAPAALPPLATVKLCKNLSNAPFGNNGRDWSASCPAPPVCPRRSHNYGYAASLHNLLRIRAHSVRCAAALFVQHLTWLCECPIENESQMCNSVAWGTDDRGRSGQW